MTTAAAHWRNSLEAWAIPEAILKAAPESPWGFPKGHHAAPETPADSPSRRLALSALPPNGSVLDVGCGGGAGSLALLPRAGSIVGVDERVGALDEFTAACAERGVACTAVSGAWPAVAGTVAVVDVVVCHHVAYNVADLAAFVEALTAHARARVVLELGASHPLTPLAPLFRHFWRLDRPNGPTAADAVAVVRELGIEPEIAIHDRPRVGWATKADEVAFVRKRLCLDSSRDAEIAEQLERVSVPSNEAWTLAWAGSQA